MGKEIDFYYMPESPPCRTVEMVALLAGVPLKRHHLNLLDKDFPTPEFLALNPRHKVPFIVDGDLKLGESRAIAAYLVNRYMPDNNTLYPRDPTKRAQVDELLNIDCSALWPAVYASFGPRFKGIQETDEETQKKLRDILGHLDKLSESKGDKKFLLGDDLTVADVSFASSLSALDGFDYDFSEFGSLSKYISNLKESMPEYDKIYTERVENVKKMLAHMNG